MADGATVIFCPCHLMTRLFFFLCEPFCFMHHILPILSHRGDIIDRPWERERERERETPFRCNCQYQTEIALIFGLSRLLVGKPNRNHEASCVSLFCGPGWTSFESVTFHWPTTLSIFFLHLSCGLFLSLDFTTAVALLADLTAR